MDALTNIGLLHIVYALCLLGIGFFCAKQFSLFVLKAASRLFSRHQVMVIQRLAFYGLFLVFFLSALHEVGLELTVLLGAAGIFTVALSFASQTAASNFISGLFLLFEHPFKLGDVIVIKDVQGTVEAIDLLSTKIKTADNTLVRIPNEIIMKSEVINASYFEIKKLSIQLNIDHRQSFGLVKLILLDIVTKATDVLTEPPPRVIISNLHVDSMQLSLELWTKTSLSSSVEEMLLVAIKLRFDKENILLR
ncbi:MAG: mechanosensitive ion channel family protein [Legionella sp.]